ncbi:MAG: M13 family peptidase, partial [Bacteroidia bacterium]
MKKQLVFIFTALCCMQAFSQKSGIQKQYMDLKVSPQQDFYGYCNGTWQRQFVLPESDARYGSFNSINDDNLK